MRPQYGNLRIDNLCLISPPHTCKILQRIWSLNRLRPMGEMVVSKILIKVSDGKYALFVRRGVLAVGGILVVYGIKPQSHRAHGGRTNGELLFVQDKYYIIFQFSQLRKVARLCELCASVVNNRSLIIKPWVCELVRRLCELCGESRKPQG